MTAMTVVHVALILAAIVGALAPLTGCDNGGDADKAVNRFVKEAKKLPQIGPCGSEGQRCPAIPAP